MTKTYLFAIVLPYVFCYKYLHTLSSYGISYAGIFNISRSLLLSELGSNHKQFTGLNYWSESQSGQIKATLLKSTDKIQQILQL